MLTLLLISPSICFARSKYGKWDYGPGKYGPENWGRVKGGSQCLGSNQSPIDINSMETIEKQFKPFVFHNYNSNGMSGNARPVEMANNGKTIRITLEGDYLVRGGGLPSVYQAAQMHFHWGVDWQRGSEHTFNGRAFPAELHIVHFDRNRYPTISEALRQPDGLLFLSFFLKVGRHNSNWDGIINHLRDVRYVGQRFDFTQEPFRLGSLIPRTKAQLGKFYRYRGSTTTPGCYESVIWTVFHQPIELAEEQIALFRTLTKLSAPSTRSRHGGAERAADLIGNNYRPIQPVNYRQVFQSFKLRLETTSINSINTASDVYVQYPNPDYAEYQGTGQQGGTGVAAGGVQPGFNYGVGFAGAGYPNYGTAGAVGTDGFPFGGGGTGGGIPNYDFGGAGRWNDHVGVAAALEDAGGNGDHATGGNAGGTAVQQSGYTGGQQTAQQDPYGTGNDYDIVGDLDNNNYAADIGAYGGTNYFAGANEDHGHAGYDEYDTYADVPPPGKQPGVQQTHGQTNGQQNNDAAAVDPYGDVGQDPYGDNGNQQQDPYGTYNGGGEGAGGDPYGDAGGDPYGNAGGDPYGGGGAGGNPYGDAGGDPYGVGDTAGDPYGAGGGDPYGAEDPFNAGNTGLDRSDIEYNAGDPYAGMAQLWQQLIDGRRTQAREFEDAMYYDADFDANDLTAADFDEEIDMYNDDGQTDYYR